MNNLARCLQLTFETLTHVGGDRGRKGAEKYMRSMPIGVGARTQDLHNAGHESVATCHSFVK